MTDFFEMLPDGSIRKKGTLPQERFWECPFRIFDLKHYRANNGCYCTNKEYRKMMIKEWNYNKSDFKNIPLID